MVVDTDGWNMFRKFLIKEKKIPGFQEVPIGKPEPCSIQTAFGDDGKAPLAGWEAPSPIQKQLPLPFPSPYGITSGVMTFPPLSGVYEQELPKDAIKERNIEMGNKVLRNIEAQETERLGELATLINERLETLKKEMSLTNNQWQKFAELTSYVRELIGDPHDSESFDAD